MPYGYQPLLITHDYQQTTNSKLFYFFCIIIYGSPSCVGAHNINSLLFFVVRNRPLFMTMNHLTNKLLLYFYLVQK